MAHRVIQDMSLIEESLRSGEVRGKYGEYSKNGVPGWIRTSGLSLRRRTLYPAELREQAKFGFWSADR